MAKASIKVTGLDDYIDKLTKLNANVPIIIERALKASYGYANREINLALKKGNELQNEGGNSKPIYLKRTNELYDSFYEKARVIWNGKSASIFVGFDQNVSMHAVYLMITGNPRIKPNAELRKAIYGNRAKITKIQTEMFEKAILEAMK